ncbi:MAG: chorismate synthase [Bdellovibrionales bacterium]|nr:chorismate synthase [Bdellovibrionales bacterium]
MGANTFGTHFQITTFGESHGLAMGVVVEGCPAGVPFSQTLLKEKMERRRPGYFPWTSSRKEPDEPELLSGVFEERTLGTPLALIVKNKNFRSKDYQNIKNQARPGHADDVWKEKFGFTDYRGGGRASGRETTGRVLGGAVAEMFLKTLYKSLTVTAFPVQIGPFIRTSDSINAPPASTYIPIEIENFGFKSLANKGPRSYKKVIPSGYKKKWFGSQTKEVEDFLIQKKSEGLSYGGTIRLEIGKPPAGLGQPVFRKLKSDMASAFLSIGACYEVSLGDVPFSSEQDKKSKFSSININEIEGSQLHNKSKDAVYGGIRGGISTGEKIIFQLKFKPPASVLDIAKKGRHDPCIVPRAVVVVEAMAWLVMADHILWSRQDRLSDSV